MDSAEYVRRITDANLRIRELEAETKVHILDGMTQRARAEKAEARVAELTEHLGVGHECTHRFHVEAREREEG